MSDPVLTPSGAAAPERWMAINRFWGSIRARLFFLVLVATVPLLAVTVYTTQVVRDAHVEEMRADLEQLARSASDQLQSAAESGEQLLKALSGVPGIARGDAAECKRVFGGILGKTRRYTTFLVTDAEGQVLCHSAGLSEPVSLADRAYFPRLRAGKRFSMGDLVVGRVSRKPVMTLAYPLLDAAGEFSGALVAGLDLQWFSERFDRSRPDLNLIFAILAEDATILYRYPDHEKWVGKRVAGTGIGQAVLSRQTETLIVETTGLTGVPTLYAVRGSEGWSATRFNITVGVAKAEMYPKVDEVFSYSLISFGVVFAVALLAAFLIAETGIRRRVTALSAASTRLAAGRLEARTGLSPGTDELGQLAAAFDGMAASLEAEHERIVQTSNSLARANRALRVLSESNSALVRAPDEAALLQDLCRIVVESGGYRMAWVGYAEQDEAKRIRPVAQAGYEEGYLEALNLTWADRERGHGPTGTAIRTGAPAVARHILTDPDCAAFREQALQRGYASSIGLPLKDGGGILGALSIYAAEPDAFDDAEVELLTELANDLAYGIHASRNRAELDRHRHQLEDILLERTEALRSAHLALQAESEKSRQAAEEYGTVLRTAMDGFWMVDMQGRFLEVNDAYCSLISYSREELLAMSIRDVEAAEAPEETAARIQTIMRTGSDRFVTRHRRKDGAVLDVEVSTNYLPLHGGRFFVFVRDVTERKRMEKALANSKRWVEEELARRTGELDESERRFRLVATGIEQAPVCVVITDSEGRIEYVNPAFTRITGYALEEALGQTPRLLKSGRQDAEVYQKLWTTILSGRQWQSEFINRRKDGSLYAQELTIAPVRDANNKVSHFVAIAQDVTQRRRDEERLAKLSRIRILLSDINALIVRTRDKQQLMDEACRIAVEQGGFAMAWIGFVDPQTLDVTPAAKAGRDDGYLQGIRPSVNPDTPGGRGIVGRSIRAKRPTVLGDFAKDPQAVNRELALTRGYRSAIALPLVVGGRVVGVLSIYAREANAFDDDEVKLLTELADDICFALDHIGKTEQIDYLAYYDALTGMPNRTLFVDRCNQLLSAHGDNASPLALILIDLERFGHINEALGRSGGDKVLRLTAERLRAALPQSTGIARISADRFAFVTGGVGADADAGRIFAEVISPAIGQPLEIDGAEYRLAARAGIALAPADGRDAETLLKNAEAGLMRAKRGGERYVFYEAQMNARVAERLTLESKLRTALEREQFVLHYQPKFDTRTRQIAGIEALIRWADPATGLVLPGKFIPLLEESGMILEVGQWALRKAVSRYREWRSRGLPAPRIAVNVSAIQLRQKEFIETVRNAIGHEHGDHGLDVELTESLLMEDIENNIAKLKALRELGVLICIDDFGTGYSSLSYIARLPVNRLKIDASFVRNMTTSPDDMAIVSTIISLAHSLNLSVVAEGVETDEQQKLLTLLRCDQMQGYLFARPMPEDQVVAMLSVSCNS